MSRPTTPHQHEPNQAEGVNRAGAEPQQQQRVPIDNANVFIVEVTGTFATADKEETLVGGAL